MLVCSHCGARRSERWSYDDDPKRYASFDCGRVITFDKNIDYHQPKFPYTDHFPCPHDTQRKGGTRLKNKYMFIDVESVGLCGEGFQLGFIVTDLKGNELYGGKVGCPHESAAGAEEAHDWCSKNTVPVTHALADDKLKFASVQNPVMLRTLFYIGWKGLRDEVTLVADCPYPVEANFFSTMLKEQCDEWGGPYPFIDVASVRFAAGLDPLGTAERLPNELPIHDPLADARQSARLFFEAMQLLHPPTAVTE